jgi:hypothetical protein
MQKDGLNRRHFFKAMGSTGKFVALPEATFGFIVPKGGRPSRTLRSQQDAEARKKYSDQILRVRHKP